jgi:hypothetical protein
MVIVGSKRMIQYEDTAPEESVRVYDRGFELSSTPANFGEYQLTYRSGDMVAPRIEATEPLALELVDFAAAITEGTEPLSSNRLGLEIVRVLEAAAASMSDGGQPVIVHRELVGDVPGAGPWHGSGNGNGHGNGNGNGHGNGHGNGNGNGHVLAVPDVTLPA